MVRPLSDGTFFGRRFPGIFGERLEMPWKHSLTALHGYPFSSPLYSEMDGEGVLVDGEYG